MARKRQVRTGEPPVPEVARPAYEVIVGLTDAFCRENLDGEYQAMCRKLAGALARKRPSPLLSGRPSTWACGIIRTIGWVNFLDDSSQPLHMKLTAIDKAFGVAESTGQGKSKAIRTMLKIRSFDPQWTLPSRMGENLGDFTFGRDGSLVDLRQLKRLYELEVFRKQLISGAPADRAEDRGEE